MLNRQEQLCLERVFRGQDRTSQEVRQRIQDAESLDYRETGVGFFSTVKLKTPLETMPAIQMHDYCFEYPGLPYGGVYNWSITDKFTIKLEAVALGGASWKSPDRQELFKDCGGQVK